jgi:hypothetical protein
MYDSINEKIKVLAVFENGIIAPRLFSWSNRNYKIKNISMRYQDKEGASVEHFFSVETDDGGVFKLSLNNVSMVWKLREVWKEV